MKTRYTDSTFRALAARLICPALLCAFLSTPCTAEPNDTKVELKLEGQFIERLVLWNKDDRPQTFEKPGPTIKVVPGKYRIEEVHLTGGYTFHYFPFPGYTLIEVDTNEPAPLKVGGPLKQNLTVKRRGGCLVLDYKLLGVAGEKYAPDGSGAPPRFTVQKGEEEIASHKFEYG